MKFLRAILLLLALLSASSNLIKAQQNGYRELKIGDTLSKEIKIKLFNGKKESQTISSYRGKWLILDFWETYCMACIIAMPKYQELQHAFKDDLSIIMVTKASAKSVNNFLEKNQFAKGTSFPFVVEDTLLNKLFYHRIIPHAVWVSPDGIIKAITSGEDVNAENIATMLKGGTTPRLKSESRDWNTHEMNDVPSDDICYRSIVKRYDPTGPVSGWISRAATKAEDSISFHSIDRIFYSNRTPLQMYYSLYMFWKIQRGIGNINPNRIVLEFKDSTNMEKYANPNTKIPFSHYHYRFPFYEWQDMEAYKEANYYSYELRLPDYLPDSVAFQYAFDDLNRVFPIKGRVEKRHVDTYVIKCLKDLASAKRKLAMKETIERPSMKMDDTQISITGYDLEYLTRIMAHFRSLPIVNETSLNGPVSMTLDFKDSPKLDRRQGLVVNMLDFDEDAFKQQLNRYGLTIEKEKRWVDLLIVSD